MKMKFPHFLAAVSISLASPLGVLADTLIQSAYYGSGTITTVPDPGNITANTNVTVSSGAYVDYAAGNRVTLGPGFTASAGSTFWAYVDDTLVGAPGNPTASNITASSFTLSWSAASAPSGIAGYQVQLNGGAIQATTNLSYNFSGLASGAGYYAQVRAQNGLGIWSDWTTTGVITSPGGGGGGGSTTSVWHDINGDGIKDEIVKAATYPDWGEFYYEVDVWYVENEDYENFIINDFWDYLDLTYFDIFLGNFTVTWWYEPFFWESYNNSYFELLFWADVPANQPFKIYQDKSGSLIMNPNNWINIISSPGLSYGGGSYLNYPLNDPDDLPGTQYFLVRQGMPVGSAEVSLPGDVKLRVNTQGKIDRIGFPGNVSVTGSGSTLKVTVGTTVTAVGSNATVNLPNGAVLTTDGSGNATITLSSGHLIKISTTGTIDLELPVEDPWISVQAVNAVGQIVNNTSNGAVFSVKNPANETQSSINNGVLDRLNIGISNSGVWEIDINIGTQEQPQMVTIPISVVRTLPTVMIVDKDRNSVSELKVAKMSEPGVIANGVLNPDLDSDRFYILIPGGAALGAVSVKVDTYDNPDSSYNDAETVIPLQTDGNDLISKSLLLVSDSHDDNYRSEGTVRTHKIQLGGKFRIASINAGNIESAIAVEAPVLVKKTVNFKVTIMYVEGDSYANAGEVNNEIKRANERFAQVGIRFVPSWFGVGTEAVFSHQPSGVNLYQPVNYPSLTVIETPLLHKVANEAKELINELRINSDIHIFYVNNILVPPLPPPNQNKMPVGLVIMDYYFDSSEAAYSYTAFIGASRSELTLAHELAHILSNKGHQGEGKAPDSISLLRDVSVADTALLTGGKRLTTAHEQAMHSSPKAE